MQHIIYSNTICVQMLQIVLNFLDTTIAIITDNDLKTNIYSLILTEHPPYSKPTSLNDYYSSSHYCCFSNFRTH